MKKITFILLFFITYLSKAQTKDVYTEKIDSIVVKSYSYYDKETSTINDTIEKNYIKLVSSRKLSPKEIDVLNKRLQFKKSYSKKRAVLSHFNVKIIYYFNNKIVQNIIYSSVTKNLTIYKLDKCIFKGQTTQYLDREINEIINK